MDNNSSNHDKGSQLFDADEYIAQKPCIRYWEYDVWINGPQRVSERRRKLIRWLEYGSQEVGGENHVSTFDNNNNNNRGDLLTGDEIMENSRSVLRTSSIGESFFSCPSSLSSWNPDDMCLSERMDRGRNAKVDGGKECNLDERDRLEIVQFTSTEKSLSSAKLENSSEFSSTIQQYLQIVDGKKPRKANRLKKRWLSKLLCMTPMISRKLKDDDAGLNSCNRVRETLMQRVRVNHCHRRLKELSALYSGQDIQAHEGLILTMKFSLDGQYLASAGQDKVVRVWQVVKSQISDAVGIPEADASCLYLSSYRSKLERPVMEKYKIKKSKSLQRKIDLACIDLPSKVFHILEKPLHVFQGHSGNILDLSWSKNNFLLSSSDDKTVCLWRIGVDRCLRVFQHGDYVTCIQFNPVDDDCFISGSIDGKVRIWAITGSKVVDWTETSDIVTAVSYCPDGQGGIIGSISGSCRFFYTSDNHFQLGTEVCISSKKSPCKRITGFQVLANFHHETQRKCWFDSQVRILDGTNVIGKYRGLRKDGHQISASFTSDGKHIISASEDSNVYIWNCVEQGKGSSSQQISVRSFEYFSSDASVAIPWPGFKSGESEDSLKMSRRHNISISSLPHSSSACVSLVQQYSSNSRSKGSATWPEERLPISSLEGVTASPISKRQYKIFRTCCQSSFSSSHAWGLVIVTAGRDGRIRSFHNYGWPVCLNTMQSFRSRIARDLFMKVGIESDLMNKMYGAAPIACYAGI